MKNLVSSGKTLVVAAPYIVAAGAGVLVGSLFGVAHSAAGNAEEVVIATEGEFELTALSSDTATVGAVAYWDNTNKRVTTTSTSNTKIGVFTVAKLAAETTAIVRLNGSF